MSPTPGSDSGHSRGSVTGGADTSSADAAVSDSPVVVGRLGSPHGVRGWLRVQSFTEPLDNLFAYKPWLIAMPGRGVVEVEPSEWRRAQGRFIAKLPGVDDRDSAAALSSLDIQVSTAQFAAPAGDEVYWHELIGMRVVNRDGDELGRINRLLETGAHDVLSVRSNDSETLVPFVDQYVDAVDREAGCVRVDWHPDW